MTIEDKARHLVAHQRVNQQDLSSKPVSILAAAQKGPGKRAGATVGQEAGTFVCVVDNAKIRYEPAEKRFHCDHLLLAASVCPTMRRLGGDHFASTAGSDCAGHIVVRA
jgi:hypothetical protein